MSCRTGPLRVGRSLRDLSTLFRQVQTSSVLPLVGIIFLPTNGRDPYSFFRQDRYTRHEVTAPRAVGPSGRTALGGLLEESFDVGDVLGEAVGWEGFEKDAAVALALDAWVEEHQDAAVVEAADEAAEALLEGDDGIGDLVVEEGLAAEGFDGLHASFDDGVGGDGEGEAVDDDAGELFALHVDSLPEGRGAEEDGVWSVAELLEEDVAGGGAVEEEWVGEFGEEALVGVAHLGVAGEEAEGAAFGDLEDAADAFGGLLGEVGLAWVGHVRREVKESLLFVVEVRGGR